MSFPNIVTRHAFTSKVSGINEWTKIKLNIDCFFQIFFLNPGNSLLHELSINVAALVEKMVRLFHGIKNKDYDLKIQFLINHELITA